MVIALVLTCLLGISVTAAVLQPRWNVAFANGTVTAEPQEPTAKTFSPEHIERLAAYFAAHGYEGTFSTFDELEDALDISLLHSDLFVFQTYQGIDQPTTPALIHYFTPERDWKDNGEQSHYLSFHLACTYLLPDVNSDQLYIPEHDAVITLDAYTEISGYEWRSPSYKLITSYTTGDITADIAYSANHASAMAYFTVNDITYVLYVNVPLGYADFNIAKAEDLLRTILDSLE